MTQLQIIIPGEASGKRLDQALALLLPGTGLRERRRLIGQGLVLLDGRPRPPGFKVWPGQVLEARLSEDAEPENLPLVEISARIGDFAGLCKPAGMHTAALAGKPGDSVEARLPGLFPDAPAAVLVNRLDQETSGLVVAALNPEAVIAYRRHEDAGLVRKTYLALVHGRVAWPFLLDQALDTDNRLKTRVLEQPATNPLRHTRIEPLEPGETSLVHAIIQKGARHQIRAHLAWAGHPIVGDGLYGKGEPGGLKLHHSSISFPGFEAVCECAWEGITF